MLKVNSYIVVRTPFRLRDLQVWAPVYAASLDAVIIFKLAVIRT